MTKSSTRSTKRATRRAFLTLAGAGLVLGGCGRVRDSRFNPFNWFGRDREEEVETVDVLADNRPLVDQVLSLKIDPTPEGAIIRAIGLPQIQGYWEAELVEIDLEDPSTAVFEFRVIPPLQGTRQGTQRSREIIAGQAISETRLSRTRSITVVGLRNRRTVRR